MEQISFVLYTNYAEILQDLSMEDMGYIFKAILDYKATNIVPELPKHLTTIFRFIKNQLDIDNEKWEQKKQARSQAGKKHKGNQYSSKINGTKNNKNGTKWNKMEQMEQMEQMEHNDNENDNDNVNDNDNNTEQPKQQVAIVPKKTPQQRVYDYFANKYKALTGFKYKSQSSDFVNLVKLLKDYKEEEIIQKIDWLEVGCVKRVFWFAKTSGVNSFTIGKLYSQWNEILPQYTAEQLKAQAEQKKEEERMKRVLAEAQKIREERSK